MEPSTEPTDTEARNSGRWCWFARWLRLQSPEAAAFARVAQSALDSASPSETAVTGHGSMYRAGLTLGQLKPGECGTVRRLFGPAAGRLRLLEMGLTPGTHIRMVRAAAFGGPVDILVRGYQLSLRLSEAAGVWLDDPDEDGDLADVAPTASSAPADAEGA